jgi:hypothetical protein
MNRKLLAVLLTAIAVASAGCVSDEAPAGPTVSVSPERVPAKGFVDVEGAGFTPQANITSHLLRPNGTEFPEMFILTDSDGGFTHEIDTLLMDVGEHALWVIDDTTGVASNVATFRVTLDQPPADPAP